MRVRLPCEWLLETSKRLKELRGTKDPLSNRVKSAMEILHTEPPTRDGLGDFYERWCFGPFINHGEREGVYFLFDASGECVYVGSSNNITSRMYAHSSGEKESEWEFSYCFDITHTRLNRLEVEAAFIMLLKPRLNYFVCRNSGNSKRKKLGMPVTLEPWKAAAILDDLQVPIPSNWRRNLERIKGMDWRRELAV